MAVQKSPTRNMNYDQQTTSHNELSEVAFAEASANLSMPMEPFPTLQTFACDMEELHRKSKMFTIYEHVDTHKAGVQAANSYAALCEQSEWGIRMGKENAEWRRDREECIVGQGPRLGVSSVYAHTTQFAANIICTCTHRHCENMNMTYNIYHTH